MQRISLTQASRLYGRRWIAGISCSTSSASAGSPAVVRTTASSRIRSCRSNTTNSEHSVMYDVTSFMGLSALLASGFTMSAYAEQEIKQAMPSKSMFDIVEDDLQWKNVLFRAEKETGIEFPLTLSERECLSGVGVRLMGGLVKVYAIGVYVDPDETRAALEAWRGFSNEDILTSDDLWDVVCSADSSLNKTIRIVVVREVGGKHMQRGFERGLAPRVKSASKKGRCKPKEAKAALREFSNLFLQVGTMKVGSDIRMTVKKGGTITVEIDGRSMGTFRSEQLSWALLDMFLGAEAVTPSLRSSTSEGLSELLRE